jgi:hypothetical protein
MKCNVGKLDRAARLIIGFALLLVGMLMPSMALGWRAALIVIAAVAIVTATLRYCPANALFGVDTCGRHGRDEQEAEQF